jgi:putative redox protein
MMYSENEKIKYQCRVSNERDSVLSDTTEDKGGTGVGFRPHEFLEAALASCINMTLRMKAEKEGIALDTVKVTVTLDRSNAEISDFIYSVKLDDNMKQDDKEKLFECLKYCPVRKTLSKKIEFKQIKEN